MSRSKVLLYHPRGEGKAVPLALLQIASVLPDFEVCIVDGRIEMTPESRIAELADDAICLGVTVSSGKPVIDALRASRAAKRRNPRLPVIWGGWHPSLLPGQCLASPSVDSCVVGQGEDTFRELVLKLAAGQGLGAVRGIWFKQEGEVVETRPRDFTDPNAFPATDFGLVDLEPYFARRGGRRLDYGSSRSVPSEALDRVPGTGWIGLDAGRVLGEVTELASRYRLDEILFNEEDFFADLSRVEAIAKGLVASRIGLGWIAPGRAGTLRRLSPEQVAFLRRSGCRRIDVGPDQGSLLALGVLPDGAHAEVIQCAESLSRAGIGARFSFVVGYPNERASTLAETYRTVKQLRKMNSSFETPIYFYAPYPGTAAPDRPVPPGFELPRSLEDWGRMDIEHSIGSWIPEPVRKFVPRYNFYVSHAFGPAGGGMGKRVASWFAKRRVRHDFYRFDIERRLVDLSKRVRTGRPAGPPLVPDL